VGVRKLTDAVLRTFEPGVRCVVCRLRPSVVSAGYILRALLLLVFYSVRSERLLVEHIDYNLLFGGSLAWAWTMRCGTTRCSRRIATGC
jgi:hypothetical protein